MTVSTTPAISVTQSGGAQQILMWIPVYTISTTPWMTVQITGATQTVNMQPGC